MHEVVREAVDLERGFCCEALSVALVGMNAGLMGEYIEFVADRLLVGSAFAGPSTQSTLYSISPLVALDSMDAAHVCCLLKQLS